MKSCKQCGNDFEPRNSLDKFCTWKCALESVREKRKKKEKKAFNAETRRRKDAAKSRSDRLREAQTAFNCYIRARDRGRDCISCTEALRDIQGKGGMFDAGHYCSIGSAPELRFDEDNCFKQCKKCNRQLSGNAVEMRKGVMERIGQERLDAIEGPHKPKKYTIDDLIEIKKYYRDKLIMVR